MSDDCILFVWASLRFIIFLAAKTVIDFNDLIQCLNLGKMKPVWPIRKIKWLAPQSVLGNRSHKLTEVSILRVSLI